MRDFWLQVFQRQVRLSSDVVDDVTLIWGVSEVVLVTDVVDLDSLPFLLLSNDAAEESSPRLGFRYNNVWDLSRLSTTTLFSASKQSEHKCKRISKHCPAADVDAAYRS